MRSEVVIAAGAAVVATACLVGAALLLKRLGPGYRVARLLGSAPQVDIATGAMEASSGQHRYLRMAGRITSEEEFPDEAQRPLVYRRRRLERAGGSDGWVTIGEDRQAVPFGIEDRTAYMAIDPDALGEGLVVITREAVGLAGDLPPDVTGRLAVGIDPSTRVRLRVDQVSAVEHAMVAGVPVGGTAGPMVTAGLGRPLIVSTLEPAAAMRLLAGECRSTALMTATLIVVGLGSGAVSIVALLASW